MIFESGKFALVFHFRRRYARLLSSCFNRVEYMDYQHVWNDDKDKGLEDFAREVYFGVRAFHSPLGELPVMRIFSVHTPNLFFSWKSDIRTTEDYARIFCCWARYNGYEAVEVAYSYSGNIIRDTRYMALIRMNGKFVLCNGHLSRKFDSASEAVWDFVTENGWDESRFICHVYDPFSETYNRGGRKNRMVLSMSCKDSVWDS